MSLFSSQEKGILWGVYIILIFFLWISIVLHFLLMVELEEAHDSPEKAGYEIRRLLKGFGFLVNFLHL